MNEKTKETYKDPIVKVYACCPLCSATLLQAEFVKNGVTKCNKTRKTALKFNKQLLPDDVFEQNRWVKRK